MSLRARRVAVYLALVGVAAVGLARQRATVDELHDLVHAEQAEEAEEGARACIDQHARYQEVRRVILSVAVVGAQVGVAAVAEVAGATREQHDQALAIIEEQAEAAVEPVLTSYEPPGCDLAAARAVVEG